MDWCSVLNELIGVIGGVVTALITAGVIGKQSHKDTNDIKNKISTLDIKLDDLSSKTKVQESALKEIMGNQIDKMFDQFKKDNGITEKRFKILKENHDIYKKLGGNNLRDSEYSIIENHVLMNGFLPDA